MRKKMNIDTSGALEKFLLETEKHLGNSAH